MKECDSFNSVLHEYIDNELSFEGVKEFERHLAACQYCGKKVEIFGKLKSTLKEKIISVKEPDALRVRLSKEETKPVAKSRTLLFPRWVYALTAIIILFSGLVLYKQIIKHTNFLIVRAEAGIQGHIDDCPCCQEEAVRIIEDHIDIAGTGRARLQKHLDICEDCSEQIVNIVKNCKESMSVNIQPTNIEYVKIMLEYEGKVFYYI